MGIMVAVDAEDMLEELGELLELVRGTSGDGGAELALRAVQLRVEAMIASLVDSLDRPETEAA